MSRSDRRGDQSANLSDASAEWDAFRVILCLRVIVFALILGVLAVIEQAMSSTGAVQPVVILVLLDGALSPILYFLGSSFRTRLADLALATLCFEVGIVTIGEYILGPQSALYGLPLYGFLIVAAAAVHSARGAWAVALLSIGSHATLVTATLSGLIPHQPDLFHGSNTNVWPWLTVLLNTTNSITFAAISGTLAGALRNALERSRVFENQLLVLNRNLEERVRTAIEELRQANRTLSARNLDLARRAEQVELFAKAVAHDLRNPITAASEALRISDSTDTSARRSLLAMSQDNLLRADRMLMGLRDLIRTGGNQPHPEIVNVRRIVKEISAELTSNRRATAPPCRIRTVGAFPDVLARRIALVHILRNLIGNAIDHNTASKTLEIEVSHETRGGEHLIVVADNGVGVAPELRERIFAPFAQGPGAEHNGLGLGLTLVEAIVVHAGGNIWIQESALGGASLGFTLPEIEFDEDRPPWPVAEKTIFVPEASS